MLMQTMFVLREFEDAEHLQYVDVEVIKMETPVPPTPKFKIHETTASIRMFLPGEKRHDYKFLQDRSKFSLF